MKLSLGMLNSAGRIKSGFNEATTVALGDVALPVIVGPVTQQILFSVVKRFRALQHHSGLDLAALNESYPLALPSNGQLFDLRWAG